MIINVIGAGLAGCECAYILAKNGFKVKLYEMKKIKKTEAHKMDTFAELVCSNSLKSDAITNACGLLKEEMRNFGSLMLDVANKTKVDAGQALAVDREKFSNEITEVILNMENIEIISEHITDIERFVEDKENITIIATGPLTSAELAISIKKYV